MRTSLVEVSPCRRIVVTSPHTRSRRLNIRQLYCRLRRFVHFAGYYPAPTPCCPVLADIPASFLRLCQLRSMTSSMLYPGHICPAVFWLFSGWVFSISPFVAYLRQDPLGCNCRSSIASALNADIPRRSVAVSPYRSDVPPHP